MEFGASVHIPLLRPFCAMLAGANLAGVPRRAIPRRCVVTPVRVLLIPLALACALVTTQAAADSLLVQRVERAKAS